MSGWAGPGGGADVSWKRTGVTVPESSSASGRADRTALVDDPGPPTGKAAHPPCKLQRKSRDWITCILPGARMWLTFLVFIRRAPRSGVTSPHYQYSVR